MIITLKCSENPWSLGIFEGRCMINMDKLHNHVNNCKICRQYYNEKIFKILNRLNNKEKESNDHVEPCLS
jgi:hypothetical protein